VITPFFLDFNFRIDCSLFFVDIRFYLLTVQKVCASLAMSPFSFIVFVVFAATSLGRDVSSRLFKLSVLVGFRAPGVFTIAIFCTRLVFKLHLQIGAWLGRCRSPAFPFLFRAFSSGNFLAL